MESIDDLLAELRAEYEQKDQPKAVKKEQPLPKEQPKPQPPQAASPQPHIRPKNTMRSPEDMLLSELRAEFDVQDRAEEIKRQEQLKEEQRRQQQIQAQKRQALRRQAELWLKQLNPRSAEGLWFEEFAYSYPSKLEAAIDYLQALQETQP